MLVQQGMLRAGGGAVSSAMQNSLAEALLRMP